MRDIEIWSRNTDWKILITVGWLLLAIVAGFIVPAPAPLDHIQPLVALMTMFLMIFVWALFRLVQPARWSRKWSVAELIVVPAAWLLLVVALAFWFSHLQDEWD